MRVGRTSFVVFVSKVVGSVLGFLATIYFARLLGAEVWGLYASVLALVAWLKLGGQLGVAKAVTKRVSEDEEPAAFATAGFLTVTVFGVVLALLVVVFADPVEGFIGRDVAPFVAVLILTGLFSHLTRATLRGERRVHISGFLEPVQITLRSIAQVGLVVFGLGLTGLLVGYIVGAILTITVGIVLLSTGYTRPERRHVEGLVNYAKYSWFSGFKSRSFNDVDILVLTAFVSPTLVGIYAIAWSIAKFLTLFGSAISATLFPEISRSEASDNEEMVATYIEDALLYGGLTTIPGLVGGVILADRLLLVYGDEFVQGTAVFGILVLSVVFNSYLKQFLNGLNGIDRPDVAFRINAAFMIVNVALNLLLVWQFGWVGAAVATAVSAAIGTSYAFSRMRKLVAFQVPFREMSKQGAAALCMGVVVLALRTILEQMALPQQNVAILAILIPVGAGVYFFVLAAISREFRTTIARNLPTSVKPP